MISICIKTNDSKAITYLLEKLKNFKLENIYFSCRKFRHYQNIIIHFKGLNKKSFLCEISNMLSTLVINIYEKTIINKIIFNEYFYFSSSEQKQILEKTLIDLNNKEEAICSREGIFSLLYTCFYEYLSINKSIILTGFITFRLKHYFEILEDQIDKSVNTFLVEREYAEFIALLKMYISTEPSSCDTIHLVYYNSKPLLLDKNKKIIEIKDDLFNAKYLSDITFSSNDYALNTLLTLLPKKIYIHLIDNTIDEFINTLKLIFENRAIFCTDCAICQIYKKHHASR